MSISNKPQTLRNSRQYRRVYDQGRRYTTPFFSAFVLRTGDHEKRFGITVTKKLGGAVERNRCKRRLREIIRKYHSRVLSQAQAANTAGFDLVINAKSNILSADFKQIEDAFLKMMSRLDESQIKDAG